MRPREFPHRLTSVIMALCYTDSYTYSLPKGSRMWTPGRARRSVQTSTEAAGVRREAGANFIVDGVRESGKVDADFLKVLEVAASRAPVVEFFYEQPDAELVEIAHAGGALVSWQLGSAAEATAAERAGCDLIVAQGTEAGGHVRGKIGLLALLGEVLPSVKVPVVAAGGIGTGRAMAAALAAGASAVRVGTRFVAAEEARTPTASVDKALAAEAKGTILTEAFSPH